MTDRLIGIGLRIYIVLGFLFIFTPIIALIVFSFNVDRFPSLPWKGFSTQWYSAVLNDDEVISSFKNSLFVGVIVAGISTFLGATAAYFLTRWRLRIQTPYLAVAVLPPCIPLIILALSLRIFFQQSGIFQDSLWAVIVSHVVLASAFAMGIVRMRLTEMDALPLPLDLWHRRQVRSQDGLGCAAGCGGVHRKATHAHDERIGPLATGDPTLLGLHAPIELFQRIIGPRQTRYVVAVVQAFTEPAQDHSEVAHRLAEPIGHASGGQVRVQPLQMQLHPSLDDRSRACASLDLVTGWWLELSSQLQQPRMHPTQFCDARPTPLLGAANQHSQAGQAGLDPFSKQRSRLAPRSSNASIARRPANSNGNVPAGCFHR